jgi:hypothetical protein
VVGWTDPEGARLFLGAVLLAYYDPDGRLIYAGRAGTGIGRAELERLSSRLQPLATPDMPLDTPPPRDSRFGSPLTLSRVHWVRPELVAEVKYLTWTEDNLLRQVVYEGLRMTSRLRTSAARHRTLRRHDEFARVTPPRCSACRTSAPGFSQRRASQIRPAASDRPYRAVWRPRLCHRLDRSGRPLSRAAAAGDALDADPFCRRLRDRQELASTRIARDVTTRSSMAASPSSAHNQTGLDFSLPAKPSTSGVGLAARRHFRIFGTRITPSDSLIAGPRGIQEVLVRRRKKPESGGLPSLAGRDRLPVENGAVSPVQ